MWSTPEELRGQSPQAPPPPPTPCVILPCCTKDQHLAINLLKWIAELGRANTDLFILASAECQVHQLMQAGRDAFLTATHWPDQENIQSNWSHGGMDASGTNSLWKQAAFGAYRLINRPFLWLEADAVPVCEGWWDKLRDEYMACGRALMGDLLTSNIRHLSGVSIYSHLLPEKLPKMVSHTMGGNAFDVADPEGALKYAHITPLIQDVWRMKDLTLETIRPGAVLCHASKDGKLIEQLRARRNGTTLPVPASFVRAMSEQVDPTPAMNAAVDRILNAPVVDIVIKSYPKDYAMLEIALQSIQKYAKGVRKIVLITPTEFLRTNEWYCSEYRNRTIKIPIDGTPRGPDQQPGYLWQQRAKLYADEYTDAQYLWFHDSDCVLTRPVDVSELFIAGKPYWLKTAFSDNQLRPDQSVWIPVMEKFVGKQANHELMRRHNFLVDRSWLEKMRYFCDVKHGKSLSDYIMGKAVPGQELALTFSEWNCLGHFLHEYHHDLVSWVDTTKDQVPEAYVFQAWSHCNGVQMSIQLEKMREAAGLSSKISKETIHSELTKMTEATYGRPAPDISLMRMDFEINKQIQKLDAELNCTVDIALKCLSDEAAKSPLHKARLMKRITKALKTEAKPEQPKRKRGRTAKVTSVAFKKFDKAVERIKKQSVERIRKPFILAIQTYPGGNDAIYRHAPLFDNAGASRIVAITTTDGKCIYPAAWDEVQIGDNKYIQGDHLPRRVLGILEWFVQQPEDLIVVAEYDNLFPGPIQPWEGMMLAPAGGKLPNAKASSFMHTPWMIDKDSAKRLIPQMHGIIAEGGCNGPEASPDVFLSYAVDRAAIPYKEFPMFTRNTITSDEDRQKAREAFRRGQPVHGCKDVETFEFITG